MSTPEQPHWLTPYEIRHGFNAVCSQEVRLERHEILHHLRGSLEQYHRRDLCSQVRQSFRMEDFAQLDRHRALDFRNKTAPIYLLKGDAEKRGLGGLICMVLHNYLYRKYFRPYRTDIDRGQFVAKVILCMDQPDTKDEDSAVDLAMHMHAIINTRLDSLKPQQFYTTRPLFRAVAIIIPGQNYSTCGLVSRVAAMSVLLVLTGEDEGLSAPISFDSIADRAEIVTVGGKAAIRTHLETAIDFIMLLEEREDAAFGPQPDPVASTAASTLANRANVENEETLYEFYQMPAVALGWNADEPLAGPSSQWVDTDKYPNWTGYGAQMDAVVMKCLEQNGWRLHARSS
ncbi:hypothetical protein QQX98_007873 [Neonectria punicea]|uniref:Uncharacterized protein n=1 Tax=Neonectria punicea TaxID=979145 RepID=A0ABR1GWU4_9HYPO